MPEIRSCSQNIIFFRLRQAGVKLDKKRKRKTRRLKSSAYHLFYPENALKASFYYELHGGRHDVKRGGYSFLT